jgi:hypothetical protein
MLRLTISLKPSNVAAKTQLFARIGDSYVALFCSITPDFKDKFFQVSMSLDKLLKIEVTN